MEICFNFDMICSLNLYFLFLFYFTFYIWRLLIVLVSSLDYELFLCWNSKILWDNYCFCKVYVIFYFCYWFVCETLDLCWKLSSYFIFSISFLIVPFYIWFICYSICFISYYTDIKFKYININTNHCIWLILIISFYM